MNNMSDHFFTSADEADDGMEAQSTTTSVAARSEADEDPVENENQDDIEDDIEDDIDAGNDGGSESESEHESETGAPIDRTESIPTRPPVVWPLEGDTRWGAAPRLNVIDKAPNAYFRNPKELANNEVYVCDGYIYVRATNDAAWKGYALAAQKSRTDSFTVLEQRLRSENRESELQHLRTHWKPSATTARPVTKRTYSPHLPADLDTRNKRSRTTTPNPDPSTEHFVYVQKLLNDSIQQLQAQVAELKAQLAESPHLREENENLRARLQRCEASNVKLTTQVEGTRRTRKQQSAEVESLKKQLAMSEHTATTEAAEVESLKKQLAMSEHTATTEAAEVESLKKQLATSEHTATTEASLREVTLIAEKSVLQDTLNALQLERDGLNTSYALLNDETLTLRVQRDELTKKVHVLEKEGEVLKRQVAPSNTVGPEIAALKEQLGDANHRCASLQEKLGLVTDSQQLHADKAASTIATLNETHQTAVLKLQQRVQQQLTHRADLYNEIGTQKQKLKTQEDQLADLHRQMQQAETIRQEASRMKDDNDSLRTRINSLDSEIQHLRTTLKTKQDSLDARDAKAQSELEESDHQVEIIAEKMNSGISTHHLPLHTFVSDVKTLLHNMETHLLPAAGSDLKAHINDVLYGQREDINKEAKRRCQAEVNGTRSS